MKKLMLGVLIFISVLIVLSCITGTFHLLATMLIRFAYPLVKWVLETLGMNHLLDIYRYIVETGV